MWGFPLLLHRRSNCDLCANIFVKPKYDKTIAISYTVPCA
jgi:hypothetical protein